MNGTSLLTNRFMDNEEYIIDFGERDVLEASGFPAVLDLVRKKVLPNWQEDAHGERARSGKRTGEHQRRVETWWLLKRPRTTLIKTIRKMPRFIVCSRVMKRPIFAFLSSRWRPDSSLTAFTFGDDYSFALLQSSAHWQWFVAKCSKLTERFRYTPESVFDTFPWPQNPKTKQVRTVA
jgi:hypothetical protein